MVQRQVHRGIANLVGFMRRSEPWVLRDFMWGSGSLPLAVCQMRRSGGFCNCSSLPGAQGSGKIQHCQLLTKSIHIIKYPLIYSFGTKIWLFSKVLSKATSVTFCILSSITSLACIVVSTVYKSLFIEIEIAIMN